MICSMAMKRRILFHRILGAIFAFALTSGCKRDSTQTAPPPPQAKRPAAQMLNIEGVNVMFPPVRIRAQATGGAVAVQIIAISDATPHTIELDLTVNDIDDPANLPGAAWHFQDDSAERGETVSRIMLNNGKAVLEPIDVHILFGRDGDHLTATIDGQFNWYEPPDAEKALKAVDVIGKITGK